MHQSGATPSRSTPMKLLSAAAAVVLSLLPLPWLLVRGIGTDTTGYASALRTLDGFSLAEATLQRDALLARAGLLRNYDPLVKATEEMDGLVAKLRLQALAIGVDPTIIDRLAAAVAEQEALTAQFNTSNALLQNSLAYFGLLSTNPVYGRDDPELARTTGVLAAAILNLTRDASLESAQAVQDRINELAAQAPTTGPDKEPTQALLAHARLLHSLLPRIDDTLTALFACRPGRAPAG
jgi:DAHL domain